MGSSAAIYAVPELWNSESTKSGLLVFCEQCGTQLPRACAKCGAAVSAEAKFCQTCGTSLADQSAAQVDATVVASDRGQSSATSLSAPSAGAERRQLTVLFCDLVGSSLSQSCYAQTR